MTGIAKILLVDAYPPLLKHYARWLAQHFVVLTAGSAREALALLDGGSVDIVITDDRLPGESGSWLLEQIHQKHAGTSRVLVSVDQPPDLEAHLSSGLVQHFLAKPFADQALIECLAAAGAPTASEFLEGAEPVRAQAESMTASVSKKEGLA